MAYSPGARAHGAVYEVFEPQFSLSPSRARYKPVTRARASRDRQPMWPAMLAPEAPAHTIGATASRHRCRVAYRGTPSRTPWERGTLGAPAYP